MQQAIMATIITALILGQTATAQTKTSKQHPEKVQLKVNGKSFEQACDDFRAAWKKWKEAQ